MTEWDYQIASEQGWLPERQETRGLKLSAPPTDLLGKEKGAGDWIYKTLEQ